MTQPFEDYKISFEEEHLKNHTTFYHIDSGQRDVSLYPNRNGFKVRLEHPITNVESMRVMCLQVPNYHSVGFLPYIIVSLGDDLDKQIWGSGRVPGSSVFFTTSPTFSNGSAPQNDVQDGFILYDDKIAKACCIQFKPSKARIDTITVRLLSPDGALLDLGSDVDIDPLKQFSLTLEFIHKRAVF